MSSLVVVAAAAAVTLLSDPSDDDCTTTLVLLQFVVLGATTTVPTTDADVKSGDNWPELKLEPLFMAVTCCCWFVVCNVASQLLLFV